MERAQIKEIAFPEIESTRNRADIFPVPGREIVQTADLFASVQQRPGKRGPNEPSDAGDQIGCHSCIIREAVGVRTSSS